jgi:hypothetical protein
METMDTREYDRVLELINNPPPGSKLAAAKAFGIDLTLLIRRLELTPTERLEELESAQQFIQELRKATNRDDECLQKQSPGAQ